MPHVMTMMSLNLSRYFTRWEAVVEASSMTTKLSWIKVEACSARALFMLYMWCSRAERAIFVSAEIVLAITRPCVRMTNYLFCRLIRSRRMVGSLAYRASASSFTLTLYFFSSIFSISFSRSELGIETSKISIIMYNFCLVNFL